MPRALDQRIHERIDLGRAVADQRERQDGVGAAQKQDADADREPLRMKPVGDDDVAFGAPSWCMRRRAKLPRHSARRTERRRSVVDASFGTGLADICASFYERTTLA